jgi:hypothetical protein
MNRLAIVSYCLELLRLCLHGASQSLRTRMKPAARKHGEL